MLAVDLISDIVPTLKASDTGEEALLLMELFKVSHLPIVNNTELLGILSDSDIYDMEKQNEAIGSLRLSTNSIYASSDQHLFEVVDLFVRYELTTLPVINAKKDYLGCTTLKDLVHAIGEKFSLTGPGGIIVITVNARDYSMIEIARIIEENDAKILSANIATQALTSNYHVTLKINREDLSPIIKSFERYNYEIKTWHMNNGLLDEVLQERFDGLMRYLDT